MKKAFTLIELLVVVLIIGILSAIALPQYTAAVEKSRMTEAITALRAIYQAAVVWELEKGKPTDESSGYDWLEYLETFGIPAEVNTFDDGACVGAAGCAGSNLFYYTDLETKYPLAYPYCDEGVCGSYDTCKVDCKGNYDEREDYYLQLNLDSSSSAYGTITCEGTFCKKVCGSTSCTVK